MRIDGHDAHLTYCSNIHPGGTWEEVFGNLQKYTTKVRDRLTKEPFGIGLRLSNRASLELLEGEKLDQFKAWLHKKNMYVFTVNGFPYGGFHHTVVKDAVHVPDWTTTDRLAYTKRLFDILSELLPKGMTGGVSTSPVSYKLWHDDHEACVRVKEEATGHLIQLIVHLHKIKDRTGQSLHLDMEPEPDGILETSREFVDFFNDYLLEIGIPELCHVFSCTEVQAESMIREHFQICYDVCHFAVGFEKSSDAISRIGAAGIRVGRIQISAALSSGMLKTLEAKEKASLELGPFDEPVYLHQAVLKSDRGDLQRFPDLRPALAVWEKPGQSELRTHFHVPIFTRNYGSLVSTNQDIVDVLTIWKDLRFTDHLEVETYTWDVLPKNMRTDIVSSIARELQWVIDTLGT